MRARPRHRSSQAGFTLIELMISLVLFSFAIAGILSIAVTVVTGFREQRISINTESAARMSMDFISDAVRGAAPGVKNDSLIEHVNTCAKGSFLPVNSSSGPDTLTVVYPSGSVVTSIRTAYASGTTAVTLTDASQLSVGDTMLISNTEMGHLAKLTAVNTTTGQVTFAAQTCGTLTWPSGGYAPGALAIRVERVTFYVTAVDGIPTLMMDPDAEGNAAAEPLAEGIEDFQIALAVDTNGDGNISENKTNGTSDEWFHNAASETFPVGGFVRGIKIWMVARATSTVPNGAYLRPALADRGVATAADAFRRRVLTSTVEIRNNELSPMTTISRNSEHGGAMLVTMIVLASLLAGSAVLVSLQLGANRSTDLTRTGISALYCAEAGLSAARTTVASNYGQWNASLGQTTEPAWLSSAFGHDLDNDGQPDFRITIRDNDDEQLPLANDPTKDNDLQVFVTSTCIKYPDTPKQIEMLLLFNGATSCYQSQVGGCGGNGNSN